MTRTSVWPVGESAANDRDYPFAEGKCDGEAAMKLFAEVEWRLVYPGRRPVRLPQNGPMRRAKLHTAPVAFVSSVDVTTSRRLERAGEDFPSQGQDC